MVTGWYAAVAAGVRPGSTVAVVGDGAVGLRAVPAAGELGAALITDLSDGIGADAVLECVGTSESMNQALRSACPGGGLGVVGLPHDVPLGGKSCSCTELPRNSGMTPCGATKKRPRRSDHM
ncbi:hypothetical protein ACFVAV_18140 [Nocardia sp. NPDC057663]|uniref:hypothetical protein n=1 Tax=Nocardia sp. NPDC057663 TaxID=3346201 RepID=UPI00366EAE27